MLKGQDDVPAPSLRFRAGDLGFVFYEDAGFPHTTPNRTYAFGTIGDAAAWLADRYAVPVALSRKVERSERYRAAERTLLGQRWTEEEAASLQDLVKIGAATAD